MSLFAAAAIEIGKAIAKSIFKLWVKDSELGNDIASNLIDLLGSKTSDILAQRKGNRQFEEIGDKISESIRPLLESEGIHVEEGERVAVALAVADTINKSRISTKLLAERNLQPARLAQHMLAINPNVIRDFSAAGVSLYERLIKESSTYVVDIASQLPSFTTDTFATVLKREDLILDKADQLLRDLQHIREQLDPMVEAERFEIEYRQAVARNLDVLQLIGADISLPNRRHRLSVAYITLSVKQKLPVLTTQVHNPIENAEKDLGKTTVSVDTALASSHRLLIRGLAGSGKTTLLQWVAVKAATKSFDGPLSKWNGILPFYIRLRQYAQLKLPKPEAFVDFAASNIAGTMPSKWVHNALKSGRAVLLIDGLDEVSSSQREEVHTWLKDLVKAYEQVRFIITSRPHAVEEGWMNHEDFSDAELQSMVLADIYTFINHWHKAVEEELQTDIEKAELGPLAEHLKEQVKQVYTVRTLATNPLLCAMLCALNRERRRQLPLNRIELYKACCIMLLERRDKESRVDLTDYPTLNYLQKQRLLEYLAYAMIQKNLSEVSVVVVDRIFTRRLSHMPGVSQEISGKDIRKLFIERSSIIREPVAGEIDFTHRTFQEFFAAQAALDMLSIDALVANAHDDNWREVVFLASGLASKALCRHLIKGLITRGDQEKEYQYQLHLLAVSCLETTIELGPDLTAEVEQRLSKLIPPKSITDAKAIASAGELAVKHLRAKEKYSATTAAYCVHALAMIGGDMALEVLEGYANDTRSEVVDELLEAWDSFDRDIYARRILSQALRDRENLTLERTSSLEGIQHLTNLTSVDFSYCEQISDLTPLANLTHLTSLDLSNCPEVADLTPLANLTHLTSLDLSGCEQVSDLAPLANLTNLISLKLAGLSESEEMSPISDLSPLARLTHLTSLDLSNCPEVADLTPLANLTHLTSLDLSGCEQVSDLAPLANLTSLISLKLAGCINVEDFSPLMGLIGLISLDLSECLVNDRDEVEDLSERLANKRNKVDDLDILLNSLNNLEELTLTLEERELYIPPNKENLKVYYI